MKKNIFLAVLFLLAAACVPLSAQTDLTWQGSGGWGPGSNYSKLFDPNAIETVTGTVVSVDILVPVVGMSKGVSLIVKPQKGDRVAVHLGPLWFLQFQDVQIRPGDPVVASGSKIVFNNYPALIATDVLIRGKEMLRLRNDKGDPVWSALVPPPQ